MRDYEKQRVRRGDIVILRPTRQMTQEDYDRLMAELDAHASVWRGVRVVVLDEMIGVHVVHRSHGIKRHGYTPRWARG